jgi:hypothetical protein
MRATNGTSAPRGILPAGLDQLAVTQARSVNGGGRAITSFASVAAAYEMTIPEKKQKNPG